MASNWFANFVTDNDDDNVELQWSKSNSNSNDGINNDEEAIVDNIPVDDDDESVNNNNIAIDNNNGTRRNYSIPLSKVIMLLLAVFALFLGVGYGSGYGIAEKIFSIRNKAAASSVSSANMYQAYGPETEEDCATGKSGKSGAPSAGKSGKSGPTSPSEGKSGKSGSGPWKWKEDSAPSATGKSGKSGPTAPSAGKSGKSGSYSPSHGKSGKSGSKCQKPDPDTPDPGECVSSPPVAKGGTCCASEDCAGFSVNYCVPNDGSSSEGYCITNFPIKPNSVDCSETNRCDDSNPCSGGACLSFEELKVEECTDESRPSGTCVEGTGVI